MTSKTHTAAVCLLAVAAIGCQMQPEAAAGESPIEAAPDPECNCPAHNQDRPADTGRFAVSADGPSLGPSDAPVTVVVFSDYQCPYCKRHDQTITRLAEAYPDDVRVVWRQLPLPFHESADEAALAALAADRQGAFLRMHALLFERQRDLPDAPLATWAAELGLDPDRFADDYRSAAAEALRRDQAEAAQFSVRGTPSTFVNGHFVTGAQPYETFDALVQESLAEVHRLRLAGHRDVYETLRASWDTTRSPPPPRPMVE